MAVAVTLSRTRVRFPRTPKTISGIFAVSGWLAVVLTGVLIGALWGAIFGAIAHALTGGRRDFTSYRSIDASEYAVTVDAEHAAEASRLLEKLP
jgi:hypothetical protein